MTISNPSPIISSLRGHAPLSSLNRYAGRILAKSPSSLRILRSPASGLRLGATSYHLELPTLPPTAPRRTESLDLATARASSESGTPYASMEHPPINISV